MTHLIGHMDGEELVNIGYAEQLTQGDRGIEADNNGDDNTATPYSNPTLSKITLVGFNDDGLNTGYEIERGY